MGEAVIERSRGFLGIKKDHEKLPNRGVFHVFSGSGVMLGTAFVDEGEDRIKVLPEINSTVSSPSNRRVSRAPIFTYEPDEFGIQMVRKTVVYPGQSVTISDGKERAKVVHHKIS